ncbi:pilus assembly protein PilP [Agaribacter flavus]|uniref:Pilus assembly protein PilP n=1 Tax=Agaribacter flavus TaxID=1902781 RepID=A0ABV7FUL9_9ALTE
MNRVSFTVFATFALSACGANIDDLVAYTEQVKQSTQVTIEPYPEFKKLEPVSYEADGLRSPFRRAKNTTIAKEVKQSPKCKQPNSQRKKQALENYGIDALKMSGVFTVGGKRFALVTANDGSLHKVTVGNYLGLFHGRIEKITQSEIHIKEMLPDGAGCWKDKTATLGMSTVTGEDDNV